MPTIFSPTWRVFGVGYVCTINHTLVAESLVVYLKGSYGKDAVPVRNVEIDGRLATAPFVATIDNVAQTVPAGGYSSFNLAGISDRISISGGTLGDVITLNLYNVPRTEWR